MSTRPRHTGLPVERAAGYRLLRRSRAVKRAAGSGSVSTRPAAHRTYDGHPPATRRAIRPAAALALLGAAALVAYVVTYWLAQAAVAG